MTVSFQAEVQFIITEHVAQTSIAKNLIWESKLSVFMKSLAKELLDKSVCNWKHRKQLKMPEKRYLKDHLHKFDESQIAPKAGIPRDFMPTQPFG